MSIYSNKKNSHGVKVKEPHRAYSIDVQDLPEEQVRLVQDFAEFLRRKLQTFRRAPKTTEEQWADGAITSFAEDWDNSEDAIYDKWQTHYHVPER